MSPSRGNAPGSFVYESAQGASVGASTFNTVYMLVDAPNSTSVVRFPYNRPIECGSLNIYENLIGSIPSGGAPLLSYYGVKGFHQNVVNGDLRVVRVGTPSIIKAISFTSSFANNALVREGRSLREGDTVYAKIQINGVELGQRNRQNVWLGIPVTIPVSYADTAEARQEISKAVTDAIVAAIKANGDVRTSIYVREVTQENFEDNDYGAYLTGRAFNGPVELIVSDAPNSVGTVLPRDAFKINESVTESGRSVYDWIQTTLTAFDDGNLSKGFVCAPAAFQIYSQNERVNLGQSLEELARDEDHKWLAMVDCGPHNVTSQERYKAFQEFDSSYGLKKDDLALVKNTIYKWNDTDELNFTSAEYDPADAANSSNSNLENGARRTLKDNQLLQVNGGSASDLISTSLHEIKLSKDLPAGLKTGDALTISTSYSSPDLPKPPLYSDTATSVSGEPLEGVFYLIIPDTTEPSNGDDDYRKKIKLATSRARALNGVNLKITNEGKVGTGNLLLDLTYSQPSWKFTQTIKNKTASLLQVNNSNGASFNTAHLPASLQKPTSKYNLKLEIRQLTNIGRAIFKGGDKLFYVTQADIDATADTIRLPNHDLEPGDTVWITRPYNYTKNEKDGKKLFPNTPDGLAAPTFSPATGTTGSNADTNITLTFNETIRKDDMGGELTNSDLSSILTLKVGNSSGANIPYSAIINSEKTVITINPTSNLGNNAVYVAISDAYYDVDGNQGPSAKATFTVDTTGVSPFPVSVPPYSAVKPRQNSQVEFFVKEITGDKITIAADRPKALASSGSDNVRINLGEAEEVSTKLFNDQGTGVVAILTTGTSALIHSKDHGFKTNDEIYFTKEVGTNATALSNLGIETQKPYFVQYFDKNHYTIASTTSNLSVGSFINYKSGMPIGTSTQIYKKLEQGSDDGNFRNANIRWTKGRKYQIDATLGAVSIKDETNELPTATSNIWDSQSDVPVLDTEIRLAAFDNPKTTTRLTISRADVSEGSLSVANHGFETSESGVPVKLVKAKGGMLPLPLRQNKTYYVITSSALGTDKIKLATTEANAKASTPKAITLKGVGGPNNDGVIGSVVLANTPFNFNYTEDSSSEPLNESNNIAGDNIFFCVPNKGNDNGVYIHPVLLNGNTRTTLDKAYIKVDFIEPSEEVPANLWNFDAVTSEDLISEALRGVNNNGTPQVEIIEKGINSHQRLNEECLKYGSSQGFLAFYGPYVKNDVDVYVPPTPMVTGMALTRYKDRPNGWILPPAGQRHSLAGARGVQIEITSAQQDISNRNGLNAIRQLPGYSQRDPDTGEVFGPVYVYGARTRANPANAEQRLYQFINTRVILNVIYATAKRAFDGEIFNVIEGAGATYDRISTIMYDLLHDNFYVPGALYGNTANEAFQVIVDDRNNTSTDLENGFIGVRAYVVPTPTLERIETDIIRVGIGQIENAVSAL